MVLNDYSRDSEEELARIGLVSSQSLSEKYPSWKFNWSFIIKTWNLTYFNNFCISRVLLQLLVHLMTSISMLVLLDFYKYPFLKINLSSILCPSRSGHISFIDWWIFDALHDLKKAIYLFSFPSSRLYFTVSMGTTYFCSLFKSMPLKGSLNVM